MEAHRLAQKALFEPGTQLPRGTGRHYRGTREAPPLYYIKLMRAAHRAGALVVEAGIGFISSAGLQRLASVVSDRLRFANRVSAPAAAAPGYPLRRFPGVACWRVTEAAPERGGFFDFLRRCR